ncbi:MAG: response regulator [Chloroflexaceae bacterium]|nr:response regulator [Chloroflexaceae bacterium]
MPAKRILVIDDEEDIQTVVRIGLSLQGWEAISATSGKQGIALALALQPDAILLDMMMPVMDGLSTLKELRSHPDGKHIPAIFLTAQADASDRQRLYLAGSSGIIAKPFDVLTLAEQVAQILNWSP